MADRTLNDLEKEYYTKALAGQLPNAAFPDDGCRIGWADYDDLGTATTPISVTGGAGAVVLTNDNAGAQANSTYLPLGTSDIWDPVTNSFDFSGLNNGDMVDIRAAIFVTTTSPNQNFDFDLKAGIGGFSYTIPFANGSIKSVGTTLVSRYNGIYIGDDNTRLNAAQFEISSDGNATIEVGGWYCKILKRG